LLGVLAGLCEVYRFCSGVSGLGGKNVPLEVVAIVLLGAVLHAGWNAPLCAPPLTNAIKVF